MSFLICHFKMFTMSTATKFRNVRFFSSTRLSSFCFFEICKIWNRILIEKKSIFCSILNTMLNFSDATAKIKSLFVKILIIFRNTNSSQFSTFTKRCNFDCESIFWNFDHEKDFLSRFFKFFFVVIKNFFFSNLSKTQTENLLWRKILMHLLWYFLKYEFLKIDCFSIFRRSVFRSQTK